MNHRPSVSQASVNVVQKPSEDPAEPAFELLAGQVFQCGLGGVVKLDRPVPGNTTQWYVAVWCGGQWLYDDTKIEPDDLEGDPFEDRRQTIEAVIDGTYVPGTKRTDPFTWVVRFDVAPLWVADGFSITDERALEMLSQATEGCMSTELAARVLVAPAVERILSEQGYSDTRGSEKERHAIETGAVHAYGLEEPGAMVPSIASTLERALALIGELLPLHKGNGEGAATMADLEEALLLLRGQREISDIDWQPSGD